MCLCVCVCVCYCSWSVRKTEMKDFCGSEHSTKRPFSHTCITIHVILCQFPKMNVSRVNINTFFHVTSPWFYIQFRKRKTFILSFEIIRNAFVTNYQCISLSMAPAVLYQTPPLVQSMSHCIVSPFVSSQGPRWPPRPLAA